MVKEREEQEIGVMGYYEYWSQLSIFYNSFYDSCSTKNWYEFFFSLKLQPNTQNIFVSYARFQKELERTAFPKRGNG